MHDTSLHSDGVLERMLCQAKAGCSEAQITLLEYFRPLLSRLADILIPRNLRPKCSSADLVQDSFIAAHQHFQQFHGTGVDELKHWLVAILESNLGNAVRAYCTCQKRQLSREVSFDDPVAERRLHLKQQLIDPRPEPIEFALQRENDEQIQAAIGELREPYRTIIRARLWEEMTFTALAKELGCSSDWVSDLFAEAIRQVACILGNRGTLP